MPNHVAVSAPPPGWIKSPLGTVADVAFSNVDKKSRPREPKVRLCNYLDVYQNDYVHDGMPYMEATAAQSEVRKFGLREGDVLITKDSETPDDIGIPAVVNDVGSDVVCGYHLALIRPRGGINPRFLAKQLGTARIRRYFAKEANGTTRYGLSTASVVEIPLWLPTDSEQRRIAEILETLDEAIRKTEQVIAKLQQMKQGLLHDLLTRGIDDNGELRDPDRHPDQFKDSPLGRIPRDWEVTRLGEVVPKAEYGVSVSLSDMGEIPVLRMMNFVGGEAELSDLKYSDLAEVRRLLLEPGDVLFNRTNSIDHVGRTGIWRGQLGTVSFASYLVRLVPEARRLTGEFLNRWLNWGVTQIRIRRWATPGVHQVNINPTNLRKTRIALPQSIDEQERASTVLLRCDENERSARIELAKIRTLKHGLLDDLLTGRVRVPVAEDAG